MLSEQSHSMKYSVQVRLDNVGKSRDGLCKYNPLIMSF